jgi:hypothetical protein
VTIRDILLKHPKFRCGYQPQTVSIIQTCPVGCEFLRKFNTIPSKINAYFDRKKIVAVYKAIFGGWDAYYIIVANDGTFFHVEY